MSPYAQVVVHFSSLTFSPYSAPTALESHAIAFSPDGGLVRAGMVVAVFTVDVVASAGAGVESVDESADCVHEASSTVQHAMMRRFTRGNVSPLTVLSFALASTGPNNQSHKAGNPAHRKCKNCVPHKYCKPRG